MRHVVMFSGGIGSWATARRVAGDHGTDDLVLLFADVKGDGADCTCGHRFNQHINGRGPCEIRPDGAHYCGCTAFVDSGHVGEDEDTYRFIRDAAANIGGQLVRVADGRNIWQVFQDSRMLGNSRIAKCSHVLKQKPCRDWLDANCDPSTTTVYVGIDWTETHRIPVIEQSYLPYAAKAPLTDPPYLDKQQMIDTAKAEGLEPPRLYRQGFPHNNCGGGCVRAGHGQFELLLRQNPDRYAVWEREEEKLRAYLGKDASILRDRSGGKTTPLTLRTFRERLSDQPDLFDSNDFGGCGCFVNIEDTTELNGANK